MLENLNRIPEKIKDSVIELLENKLSHITIITILAFLALTLKQDEPITEESLEIYIQENITDLEPENEINNETVEAKPITPTNEIPDTKTEVIEDLTEETKESETTPIDSVPDNDNQDSSEDISPLETVTPIINEPAKLNIPTQETPELDPNNESLESIEADFLQKISLLLDEFIKESSGSSRNYAQTAKQVFDNFEKNNIGRKIILEANEDIENNQELYEDLKHSMEQTFSGNYTDTTFQTVVNWHQENNKAGDYWYNRKWENSNLSEKEKKEIYYLACIMFNASQGTNSVHEILDGVTVKILVNWPARIGIRKYNKYISKRAKKILKDHPDLNEQEVNNYVRFHSSLYYAGNAYEAATGKGSNDDISSIVSYLAESKVVDSILKYIRKIMPKDI